MTGGDLSLIDRWRRLAGMDIYLIDQLLRERLRPGMVVCDAGCGSGRNAVPLLEAGFDVYGLDPDARAIAALRARVPEGAADRFHVEPLEAHTFPEALADYVICNAVLHFARDESHFTAMLDGVWRLVRPGGYCFTRLASDIGMDGQLTDLGAGRYRLPDGSERFLVNAPLLQRMERRLGAERADPLKTTVVDGLRAMTTWVLRRPANERGG